MNQEQIKKAACCFCGGNCGVLVHVKDGRVTRVEGNRGHALTLGHVCERVGYAVKWLYHPDQLMYPLKRAGGRGEGKWQRVTWDQALDEIAVKLKDIKERYGAESLAITEGTYRGTPLWARSRFCSLFGNSQNVTHPGLSCGLNCNSIELAMLGGICNFVPYIAKTSCLVLWSQNPSESAPRTLASMKRRQEKGGFKYIVIDPRRTGVAEQADMWLQIRPGTDCALALGWLNVIINEGLYDKEFVQKWTVGFDQLTRRVQDYPPQKVAAITGLTSDQITESARMYAMAPSACISRGLATDQFGRNATRVEQARVILRAITGNLDIPGGDLITAVGPEIGGKMFIREAQLEFLDKIPPEQRRKQLGSDRFKLMTWPGYQLTSAQFKKAYGIPESSMHRMGVSPHLVWQAILTGKPYPVKAVITWGSNPLMWAANTKLVHQALSSPNLELHVVCDFWLTPSAEMADYVLPVSSWLERPICSTFEDIADICYCGERSIPPLGERKDDYTIWRELGIRLGQKEYWPWKSLEEVISYQLEPLGITYEQFTGAGYLRSDVRKFKKYEKAGFPTASGKLELYCTVLEKLGYDPLPFYEEPPESPINTPELLPEYPLILITGGRFMPMHHSEHRQWGIGTRERYPNPMMDIHPETAQRYGIADGDWIWIETRRGRIKQKARLTDGILPDVVNVQASWWFPEMPGNEPSLHGLWESNANVLTLDEPDSCDPLTGGPCSRALLCRVYRV